MPGPYSNTKHKEIWTWLNKVIEESKNPFIRTSFLTLPSELRQAILLLTYGDGPLREYHGWVDSHPGSHTPATRANSFLYTTQFETFVMMQMRHVKEWANTLSEVHEDSVGDVNFVEKK